MTDVDPDTTGVDLARVADLMAMDPTAVVTVTAGEVQRMLTAVATETYRQVLVSGGV